MSLIASIVIETRPGEVRTALVDQNNIPITFAVERTYEQSRVGGIYLGRVRAVRKNIGAAFIDIGTDADGFLNIKDAERDTLGTSVHEGAAVLVQVTRDAEEGKGPALSLRVDLAGAHMVMTPGKTAIGISRRITGDEDRERIRTCFDGLDLGDVGLVVRTAAQNTPDERLRAEASALHAQWQAILQGTKNQTAPAELVVPLSLAARVVRDGIRDETREIIVDSALTLKEILDYANGAGLSVEHIVRKSTAGISAFEEAGIADAFDAAMSADISLPGGGTLILTETPAMTTIDVNAGKSHGGDRERLALDVNLEAATAIARALRQRSIGGLIAIDFLKMEQSKNRDAVLAALRDAFADDPRAPRVGTFSSFGLVDVVCRRDGKSLGEKYLSQGLTKTPEAIALDVLNALQRHGGASACVCVSQPVKEALEGPLADSLKDLEDRLGFVIRIDVAETTQISDFKIMDEK